MGVSNRQIQEFVTALQAIREHGIVLKDKRAGAVKEGDYLVYEHVEHTETDDPRRLLRTVKTRCGRVCATGGVQGSGPDPSQHCIAVEGDERIQRYIGGDHVLVLEAPEETEGVPEGRLTSIEGTG